jgi:hypothetical protein
VTAVKHARPSRRCRSRACGTSSIHGLLTQALTTGIHTQARAASWSLRSRSCCAISSYTHYGSTDYMAMLTVASRV